MEIKGVIDVSLVDWDGRVSSVIFLPHCNFRCPYCYNSILVLHPEREETTSFEQIERYLTKQREWIDGVCITGGEPTIHSELSDLCLRLKEMAFQVKVDTNGSNPEMIKVLIEKERVDFVAMDIKAPLDVDKYSKSIGINAKRYMMKVEETIKLLFNSGIEYEFRTTVVPTLHTKRDIMEISNAIKGCRKYIIQNYIAEKETINPDFRNLKPFTEEEMHEFLTTAQKNIPETKMR